MTDITIKPYHTEHGHLMERWIEMVIGENAEAIKKDFGGSNAAFTAWFWAHNPEHHYSKGSRVIGKNADGTDCIVHWNGQLMPAGATMNLPADFVFTDKTQACPKAPEPTPEKPVTPIPAKPQPQPQPDMVTLRAPAQFNPTSRDAADFRQALAAREFLVGEPPRDAHATNSMDTQTRNGDAFTPPPSGGADVNVNLRGERDRTDRRPPSDSRSTRDANFVFHHANTELEHSPEADELINADGSDAGPDTRRKQKAEVNTHFAIDANGDLVATREGTAVISENRFYDPYHRGIWTDVDTAMAHFNKWDNTAEGMNAITSYMAVSHEYGILGDKYYHSTGPATKEDAERLLQMNTQLALSPLTWSAAGNPPRAMGDASVIRKEMEQVLANPNLSAADRAALQAKWTPIMGALDNPGTPGSNKPGTLETLTGGAAGRANWFSAYDAWADERLADKHSQQMLIDGFNHRPGEDPHHRKTHDEALRDATITAHAYGARLQPGFRGQEITEQNLGTAVAFNPDRQTARAMSDARVNLASELLQPAPNPADSKLDAAITSALNTPGGMDGMIGSMFDASRVDTDNYRLLGVKDTSAARALVEKDTALLAGKDHADDIEYHRKGFFTSLLQIPVSILTLDNVQLRDNRNQNNGRDIQALALARWNDPDPVKRDQYRAEIRQAYSDQLSARTTAEQTNRLPALAPMVLDFNPHLSEYNNNGQTSTVYQNFRSKLSPAGGQTIDDQATVNSVVTDNTAAAVVTGTRQDQGTGARTYAHVSDADALRLANNQDVTIPRPVGTTGTVYGTAVIVPSVPASQDLAARLNSPDAAIREKAQLELRAATIAPDPHVTTAEMDRNILDRINGGSPTLFSMLALQAMTDGGGKSAAAQNIQAYVAGLADRGSDTGQQYAAIMARNAQAMLAAQKNGDSKAIAAVEAKATAELQTLFSGDKSADALTAASGLASSMGGDSAVAQLFAGKYDALAANDGAQMKALLANVSPAERSFLSSLQAGSSPAQIKAAYDQFMKAGGADANMLNAGGGISRLQLFEDALLVTGFLIPTGGGGVPVILRTPPGCGCL